MAHPRVFLSSAFYDLRQVRSDLEHFIRELGYDPILNERGNIAYGSQEHLEEYCYREIDLSDILISIIGGRYGSSSQHEPYSISQMEIKTALELGKQVYIFVEKNVLAEYKIYLTNKGVEGMKYPSVDDVQVFKFLEEVHSLPNNNTIAPFDTSHEIMEYLKEQWAGLFQRFLHEQSRVQEIKIVQSMQDTSQTLNQLVNFLTEERRNKDQAIKDILLMNHPAFERLRDVAKIPHRVIFTNFDELDELLTAKRYHSEDSIVTDEERELLMWTKTFVNPKEKKKTEKMNLQVDAIIFNEDGKLKVFTKSDWNDQWITQFSLDEDLDNIPF